MVLFSATQCTGLDELHCVALVEEIERAIEEMSIYETANPSGTTDGASVAGSVVGVHEPFVGDRPAADRRGVLITGLAVVAIVGLMWRKSTSEDGLLAPSPPPPPPPPPLSSADVNRLEFVSCNEVACGQLGECGEDTYCAFPDELHEVSCCSDFDLGGWNQCSVRGRTVYGERDAGALTCTSGATLPEAAAVCTRVGARLCTMEELEADCTADTGCNHDWDLVWSSDSCTGNACRPAVDPRQLSTCNEVGCGQRGECGDYTFCAFPFEKHSVSCCSDVDLGGWKQCSVRGRTVYGERDASGLSCTHGATLARAQSTCERIGARLCTLEELEADCTADTGCLYDYQTVWTSTPGDPHARADVLLAGQG